MIWVKAFHVIFMVTWFAGLFYLPRLFVYHADADDEISNERFKIMEKKLFAIMTIGAVLTVGFGLWMLFDYAMEAYYTSVWIYLKLLLVAGLIYYHYYCYKLLVDFRYNANVRDGVFFRLINEIPVAFLFGIIILVIVRPF
ncbi:MAG: CopD family protein [Gammaproteobacteria bacterium]|nr:CopD family protein [Gammaproteobacteria bacterium]